MQKRLVIFLCLQTFIGAVVERHETFSDADSIV